MRGPAAVLPRLMGMMFLQFFVWGAWYVTAPSYLNKIGFAGGDIGWTYSVGPIAGMISPLFVGMVADRFFPAQRVMGVLHLLAAGTMVWAISLMTGANPAPSAINWVLFAHMLCYFPTLALANTIAMRNISDTERLFPWVRVLGTIGWIVASGVVLTAFGWAQSVEMFWLAAGASALLGVYAFTLPHTPPVRTEGPVRVRQLFGLDALGLLRDRNYGVFMLCSFLICIPLAFYYQLAARAVQTAGIEDFNWKMTFGQMSEVLFMAVMPFFFARLGVKWMLAVGMLAWAVRYLLFAIGTPNDLAVLMVAGILLHGICYDFFFVTGQIYTDKFSPSAIRGQAQGLLVLFTLGLGMLLGAQIAGEVEARHTPPEAQALLAEATAVQDGSALPGGSDLTALSEAERKVRADALKLAAYEKMDWAAIWRLPAIAAAVVLVLFVALFRGGRSPRSEPAAP